MAQDSDKYDLFISYVRKDNENHWIARFVGALAAEYRKISGRRLNVFFDKKEIKTFTDWQHALNDGIAASRMFLAFISPRYFASEWCRKEWRAWLDHEIAKHILTQGSAPVYIITVPGLLDNMPPENVAREVASLCDLPAPHDSFLRGAMPLIDQVRRRQLGAHLCVQDFYQGGLDALHKDALREALKKLSREVEANVATVRAAASNSISTVPTYNKRFSGRVDELNTLYKRLTDNRTGVVSGIHGLGGVGKTELAYAYAHAFAWYYPGGRFNVACDHKPNLQNAILSALGNHSICSRITDEQRKKPDEYFQAVRACLQERIAATGRVLLVLDNVSDLALLSREQTDLLTAIGPQLHLLATTRLLPSAAEKAGWLTLGELPEPDALDLLEKHRPFIGPDGGKDNDEWKAALSIVRRLGGFALAVELVGAWLLTHDEMTYVRMLNTIGLENLEKIGASEDVELHRHTEKRLSAVLGPMLEQLTTAQLHVMEYAALLAPDAVPLPWLKALAAADFPELAEDGELSNPWKDLCRRLTRLALFQRIGNDEDNPESAPAVESPLVRVHRLVQELVISRMSEEEQGKLLEVVKAYVTGRLEVLEKTTQWQDARWELEPLDKLVWKWDQDAIPSDFRSWFMNQMGMLWDDLAQWGNAELLLRRALEICEKSYGPEHPKVATDLNNLAGLLQATNRLAEAEPLMRRALEIWEKSYGPEHTQVATALNNLAQLLKSTNRLSEAEPLMRRALEIDEKSYGSEHPKVATKLDNLAHLLLDTNRLAEAEPLMRRALEIDEKSYGPEHPVVATGLNNLAQLLSDTNRLSEAEPLIRRALEIDEKSYGPEHPVVATALNNLAGLLESTNRLSEAEPLYRRALEICEKSYGPEHPVVATVLNNLAQLLQDTNRLAEAEPLYRRALVIDEKSYGPEHPDVARDLNNLTWLLSLTNRLSEAEPLMRRTCKIVLQFTQTTGHQHPHLQTSIKSYVALLLKMDKTMEEARDAINALLAEYGMRFDNQPPTDNRPPSMFKRIFGFVSKLFRN